jgi:nucleotide-binding universal stress UspA family protein
MTDETSLTVLVPVDVSTQERPDPELLQLLGPAHVVLVGWYPVPDQTAPGQLQAEHESEAVDRIEAVAADLPDDGPAVDTVVVFTHDRATTVDRLAEDTDSDVVVVPNDVTVAERVLVPIRGDVNMDRILRVVGGLLEDDDVSVTLFHATAEGDTDPSVGELLLDSATDALAEDGIDPDRIERRHVTTESPVDEIVDAAANHDVVVIGETEPSLVERVLGDVPSEIIDRSGRPVLVVRNVE